MELSLFPPSADIMMHYNRTPGHMYPTTVPYAVMGTDILTPGQCESIVEFGEANIEAYDFSHCKATTREFKRPLNAVLDPIVGFAKRCNAMFFRYNVDYAGSAWMQTYTRDGSYVKHADAITGQTRKLTAVAMLTNGLTYRGGDLRLYSEPLEFTVNPARGVVVVFQSHLLHEVTPLLSGVRQTINLGLYGPSWK